MSGVSWQVILPPHRQHGGLANWIGGIKMAVFMVERDLTGITMDELAGAQKAAIETSQKFTAEGKPVRYIRSTFVPGDSRCMCLFESDSQDLVRDVNVTAKLPFNEIVEALDLTP